MNRGACHQRIFSDESDYQYFMSLLLDTRNLYSFIVHAYCLMTNHYHLLIDTKDEDISKIMKLAIYLLLRDMERIMEKKYIGPNYKIFENSLIE